MTLIKATYLRNNLPEVIFYLLCWVFVLVVPIFLEAYDSAVDSEMDFCWSDIGFAYLGYLPFAICFLVAKAVLEPRLYYAGRYRSFIVSTILVSLLVTWGFSTLAQQRRMRRHEHHPLEHHHPEPQSPQQTASSGSLAWAVDSLPLASATTTPQQASAHYTESDHIPTRGFHRPNSGRHRKPLMRGPFVPMFFMTLLMMVASLGVSMAFRYRRDQLELKEKQAARLQSELDYLKYQINPHFFMNTLNNIHALVDIDGELAKEAIIELSRMMRYLLYESNHPTVPLSMELDFIQQYLQLMRLRCDQSVNISYQPPAPSCVALQSGIPPMLLISFIENAFKHGISHQQPSYIQVTMDCQDQRFHFHCCNSNFSRESNRQQQGGVGLDNVRKRLELLYPGRYTLQIVPSENDFTVDLWLPTEAPMQISAHTPLFSSHS